MANTEERKVKVVVLDFGAGSERWETRGTPLPPNLPDSRPSVFYRQFEEIEGYKKETLSKETLAEDEEALGHELPKGKKGEVWSLSIDTMTEAQWKELSEMDRKKLVMDGVAVYKATGGVLSWERVDKYILKQVVVKSEPSNDSRAELINPLKDPRYNIRDGDDNENESSEPSLDPAPDRFPASRKGKETFHPIDEMTQGEEDIFWKMGDIISRLEAVAELCSARASSASLTPYFFNTWRDFEGALLRVPREQINEYECNKQESNPFDAMNLEEERIFWKMDDTICRLEAVAKIRSMRPSSASLTPYLFNTWRYFEGALLGIPREQINEYEALGLDDRNYEYHAEPRMGMVPSSTPVVTRPANGSSAWRPWPQTSAEISLIDCD